MKKVVSDLSSGIVREKSDAELFSIDGVGAAPEQVGAQVDVEPPKKRRNPLHVDQVLETADNNEPIQPYIPKNKRPKPIPTEKPVPEQKESYDVWTKDDIIAAPENLPPPATLPYSTCLPAKAPSTIRSETRLLRLRDKAQNVIVPAAGQSYNPTLDDWEELVNETAEQERQRLLKIAEKERVAEPEEEETPQAEISQSEEEEPEKSESFLGKRVKKIRKTRAQRNRQSREMERVTSCFRTLELTFRNVYVNWLKT